MEERYLVTLSLSLLSLPSPKHLGSPRGEGDLHLLAMTLRDFAPRSQEQLTQSAEVLP